MNPTSPTPSEPKPIPAEESAAPVTHGGAPRRGVSGAVMFWVATFFIVAGGMTLWGAWKLVQRETDGLPGTVVTEAGDANARRNLAPEGDSSSNDDMPAWLDEFTLTERSGKLVDSRDLAGKVWVASFFFATCPSACVQQNTHIQTLQQEFEEDDDVVFVSITCDPKQDTPEKLREYARRFEADPKKWLFLTGDMNYIRRVGAEKFGMPVHEQTHKNNLIVVDKAGEVQGDFDWSNEFEMADLRKLVRKLGEEEPTPKEADNSDAAGDSDDGQASADEEAEAAVDDASTTQADSKSESPAKAEEGAAAGDGKDSDEG